MSGMVARRECFENTLPMFVLLALLLLAKCVSGDASSVVYTSSSVSEGTNPSTAVSTGQSTLLHPTSAPTNIKNTSPATTHASSPSSVHYTTSVPTVKPNTGESLVNNSSSIPPENNSTNKPPVNKTSNVPPINSTHTTNVSTINNTTVAPTISITISSSEAPITKTTNSPKETDGTEPFSATTEKSTEIASTSGAASSTEKNLLKNFTRHTSTVSTSLQNSSEHTDVKPPLITTQPVPSVASEGNKTTVTQSSKITNTTPVSASTTAYNASESTLSPVDSGVTSTTWDNTTMPTNNTTPDPELLTNMTCKNNKDCNEAHHLICNVSSGQCTCLKGYFPMTNYACGKKLGAVCDGRCDAQNSRCETVGDKSLCVCEDGLTASTDGTFCYGMPLMFEDACDHDANCTILGSHVRCKQFSCRCEENYVRWNGLCLEKIDRLDAPCNIETQVCYSESERSSVNNRICSEGFCRCDSGSGFVPHDGMCKKKISLLGAPCNASTHVCHLDEDGDDQRLQCHKGICQCKDVFLLDDGRCKKKIDVLGAKCSPGTEICFADTEGKRRQCTDGICQCKSSFVNENKICKQKISVIGASCNSTADVCYFEEDGNQQKTHCKDGVCNCKAEFALTDKKCQKLKSGNNHAETLLIGLFAWIPLIAVTVVMR